MILFLFILISPGRYGAEVPELFFYVSEPSASSVVAGAFSVALKGACGMSPFACATAEKKLRCSIFMSHLTKIRD